MAAHRNLSESKLIRALVERLLREDFSPQECWQAAEAFENEDFCKKLATVVRAMSEQGQEQPQRPNSAIKRSSAPIRSDSSPVVDQVFSLYKRRKITKRELADHIREVSGYNYGLESEMTAREMVQAFVSIADQVEINVLVNRLMSPGVSDPYLKGILRKG